MTHNLVRGYKCNKNYHWRRRKERIDIEDKITLNDRLYQSESVNFTVQKSSAFCVELRQTVIGEGHIFSIANKTNTTSSLESEPVWYIIRFSEELFRLHRILSHEEESAYPNEAFNIDVRFLRSQISCNSLGSKHREKLSKHRSFTRISVSTIS